jgi:extradiol dioxygenase family protein
MSDSFHLSIGVKSLRESVEFFTDVLGATLVHEDAGGYVNLELAGAQLTLTEHVDALPELPAFHFGINVSLDAFGVMAKRVMDCARDRLVLVPTTVDAGTPRERRKMYLRCPAGYLIEIKGR